MEKLTKTKYLELNLDSSKRYLFISDVHGNLSLLKKALAEVGLSKDDYLFIIGDIVEKGKENLKILDFLMDLKKDYQLYLLRGNCDQVFNFLIPPVNKDRLLYFAKVKGNSVINEMADILNIQLDNNIDANRLGDLFYQSFKKYYDFVDSFYDVILLNQKYLLVHGGLDSLEEMPLYNDSLLKNDFYLFKAKYNRYLRIVGHNPTCNLCKGLVSNAPILDLNKNVIAIDGGNNVSLSGELNVISIIKDKISYETFNNYPLYRAKNNIHYENERPIHTNSYLSNLEFIEKNQDYYLFNLEGNILYSHKLDVIAKDNTYFTFDATNSFISLEKNDSYYLALRGKPYSIIIKNGQVGLVKSEVILDDLCIGGKI